MARPSLVIQLHLLFKRLINKQDVSHIPAVCSGISNNEKGRQDHINETSSHKLDCTTVGLTVNPLFPYLGASPDGMVMYTCCGSTD